MLNIRELDFSYGGVKALTGVSMAFRPGRMTCIMGRNGVGKTTLMRNVIGLLTADRGSITLSGDEMVGKSAHQRARMGLAMVPQGRMIFPKLTVEENLKVGLQARVDGKRSIPNEVFETFPVLDEMRGRKGGDLSGGQQQQLAIGRAMVSEPKVMLLDEPTEGIQPNIIQRIGQVLADLMQRRGTTIVLVEQYVDFVRQFGDFFYVMNRGAVVAQGRTAELTADIEREHLSV